VRRIDGAHLGGSRPSQLLAAARLSSEHRHALGHAPAQADDSDYAVQSLTPIHPNEGKRINRIPGHPFMAGVYACTGKRQVASSPLVGIVRFAPNSVLRRRSVRPTAIEAGQAAKRAARSGLRSGPMRAARRFGYPGEGWKTTPRLGSDCSEALVVTLALQTDEAACLKAFNALRGYRDRPEPQEVPLGVLGFTRSASTGAMTRRGSLTTSPRSTFPIAPARNGSRRP
jgi:hypothetical protein